MMRQSAFLLLAVSAWPLAADAQGSVFTGRVLTDSGVAILGAEVALASLQRMQRTNEKGEFVFSAVPAGEHVVGVRILGFAPKTDTIEVADAGEVRREFKLARTSAILPLVPVTATLLDRKLSEFHERRKFGMGRFLDSAEFANAHGTRTSDRLRRLPGLVVLQGRRATEATVASSRSRCAAGVWLDGINVGSGYNVNLLDPSEIAAMEWYASQITAPARFSGPPRRGQSACGVLVIWLR